ncbi:MAG TPA: glycosyltransferase [Longimicrobium sp.]
MDISVIINTFDQEPAVNLALCALSEQDFTGSWEIIVVDDGSADATAQIVASRSEESRIPIVYVRIPNRGMRWCYARNVGMRLSTGRYLLFFDGDMVPDREVVRLHWTLQREAPALVVGDRLWRNASADLGEDDSAETKLQRLRASTESSDAACRRRQAVESALRENLLESPEPWRACFGCHISIPSVSDVFYDETMRGWGPADMEFAYRVQHRHELPVRFIPDARAWHVEHSGAWHNPFRSADVECATEYVRQMCYMYEKHRNLNLMGVIEQGFDRLVLDESDRWRVADRDPARDPRQMFAIALEWYTRRKDSV